MPLAVSAGGLLSLDTEEPAALYPYLEILATPSASQLSFDQIRRSKGFKPVDSASSPAVNRDNWYRFQLHNASAQDASWVIDFAEILFDDIEFYYQRNGQWLSSSQGLIDLSSEHPVYSLYVAFPLDVAAGQTSTFYFRFNSSHQPLVYPVLYSSNNYPLFIGLHAAISLIFIGVLLGITVVVTATIFSVGEHKGLLIFTGVIISIMSVIAYTNGFLKIMMSGYPELHRALYAYLNLVCNIFMLLFVRELLQFKQRRPQLDRILVVYISAAVIYPLVHYFYGVIYLPAITSWTSLTTIGILFAIGIDAYRQKLPSAFFYLVAMSLFLLPTLYTILGAKGFIPYSVWGRHSYEIGALFLGVFISLSIRDTLRQTIKIKDESQSLELVVETRDKMKSEFLAAMSHEIRTPINGVLGMAQLLQMTRQTQTQAYYTETIINSGQTLLTVINDILDLSKVEAGKMVLEKESVDLSKLVVYINNSFVTGVDHKKIKYSHYLGVEVPVFVIADSVRLEQVISNLLSNAGKFTREGEIIFTISKLADVAADKARLRFSIKDSGVGIPKDMQEIIFDPYIQDRGTSVNANRVHSTGLGLSICKRLVELMGGTIAVSSEPGKGSTFWFDVTLQIDVARQKQFQSICDQLAGYHLGLVNMPGRYAGPFALHLQHWGMQVSQCQQLEQLTAIKPAIDVAVVFVGRTADMERIFAELGKASYKSLILMPAGQEEPALNDSTARKINFLRVPAGVNLYAEALYRLLLEVDEHSDFAHGYNPQSIDRHASLSLQVLVVEDNPTNQKVIEAMLKKLSCSVLLAENGAEGLKLFQQHHQQLDLLIMDCEMPVMDGFECTMAIRHYETEKGLKRTPIIALTAHALPINNERCVAAGMDSVLTKPVKFNQLEKLLETIQSDPE